MAGRAFANHNLGIGLEDTANTPSSYFNRARYQKASVGDDVEDDVYQGFENPETRAREVTKQAALQMAYDGGRGLVSRYARRGQGHFPAEFGDQVPKLLISEERLAAMGMRYNVTAMQKSHIKFEPVDRDTRLN